jgi:hypothetical protein
LIPRSTAAEYPSAPSYAIKLSAGEPSIATAPSRTHHSGDNEPVIKARAPVKKYCQFSWFSRRPQRKLRKQSYLATKILEYMRQTNIQTTMKVQNDETMMIPEDLDSGFT